MTLDIRKDGSHGYVVVRVGGTREQHAHLKKRATCRLLIRLINRKLMPKSEWLIGSCRRLLTEEEFQTLKKPKDKYVNRAVR